MVDYIEAEELNVKGLYYIDNIKEDTSNVIDELDKLQWHSLTTNKNSRLVQHYGYKSNYTTYNIYEKCDKIPKFLYLFKSLLTDICLQLELIDKQYEFNQCIVNNYLPGQGISKHIDFKDYGNIIGCFTIGSGATMIFKKGEKINEIYVKPNSLYIMSEDARYLWTHEMNPRKYDIINDTKLERKRRVSITFRNVQNPKQLNK